MTSTNAFRHRSRVPRTTQPVLYKLFAFTLDYGYHKVVRVEVGLSHLMVPGGTRAVIWLT